MKKSKEEISDKAVQRKGKRKSTEDKQPKYESKTKKQKTEEKVSTKDTLIVRNFPFNSSDSDFLKLFHNAIIYHIPKRWSEGVPKGLGKFVFVGFETDTEAAAVREKLHEQTIDHSQISVSYAESMVPSPYLWVWGLPTQSTVKTVLQAFTTATTAQIQQRGAAIVHFDTCDDSTSSLKSMYNHEISGKTISMMYAKEEDVAKINEKKFKGCVTSLDEHYAPCSRLMVHCLSYKTTEKKLIQLFVKATSADIAIDKKTGNSRGYGFVDFPSTELATDAQKLMTGKMVDKCKIVVTFAGQENKPKDENENKKKKRSFTDKLREPSRKLMVHNLPYKTTEDDIYEAFKPATLALIKDMEGVSKGYAFMDFDSIEEATTICDKFNNKNFHGNVIRVRYAAPRKSKQDKIREAKIKLDDEKPPSDKLMVNNLSYTTNEETLYKLFPAASSLAIAKRDQVSRGFAFVDFKSTSDAKAARVLTNNKKIDGNNIRVSFATPKEQHNEYRNRTSDYQKKPAIVHSGKKTIFTDD